MNPISFLKRVKTKTYLQIFGGIVVVLTLFRFIASDYWWVRIFDFPHVQLTVLTVVAFLAYFIKFDFKWRNDYIFAGALLACMLYQFLKIYNYTPLASFEIENATEIVEDKSLSFYTANVFQKNKEHEQLLNILDTINADVLLFTETHKEWQQSISNRILDRYPYRIEKPLPNTYGMLLYSKLELVNPKIKFQVDDSIPSIHTKVIMPLGDTIQLYAIHPTPPMPLHNPKSTERDKEMMLTAKLANKSNFPVAVIGDFNDVAWSQTTTLFQRISGLLDPRKGRGLYNTFNAKNPLMRWPLDHIFVGPEFRVVTMERGEDINSDHFPMYIKLSLEPEKATEQKLKPPTKAEIENCEEQIKGSSMSLKDVY
ncbi:endonuclease/exonuclease/phosphatase family protein [Marinirhabdus gelatinilytica]|uniref:Endonuclease/exonuclease/phosphatase (EEP) superfamily protein YafD n=1 Tax=Marinirhabdus gelatinilytica TaxID=1703343 RepID=A0A370QAD3_9FLAO|nr:endonuclease/exonuclease/phosphatase family protein [Marinirhabdus gelatinilytica]RDK85259.1 endonuclease/exonuclease/phosphatase (EEP) superfamily protein YafD [Marinirhabdus gelatinilytica]